MSSLTFRHGPGCLCPHVADCLDHLCHGFHVRLSTIVKGQALYHDIQDVWQIIDEVLIRRVRVNARGDGSKPLGNLSWLNCTLKMEGMKPTTKNHEYAIARCSSIAWPCSYSLIRIPNSYTYTVQCWCVMCDISAVIYWMPVFTYRKILNLYLIT